MEFIIIWIVLCIIVAAIGKDRKIGGAGAFFISLFFSPLIGFIVVAFSDKKKEDANVQSFKTSLTEAKREEFKGNKEQALTKYQDALYHVYEAIRTKKIDAGANRKHVFDCTQKIKELGGRVPDEVMNFLIPDRDKVRK